MNDFQRILFICCWAALPSSIVRADENTDWPGFRGPGGRGVAEGFSVATSWDASLPSSEQSSRVLWSCDVPGLGHSSPTIIGDRIFLATAIAEAGDAPLKVGSGGEPTAADDNGVQSWVVLCFDKATGNELWRRTAKRGRPLATRHAKATHANTTVTVGGRPEGGVASEVVPFVVRW